MTPEERFTKLEEAMLVNASLMSRIEQRAEAHEEGIAELRASQVEMRASQVALFEHMDRFIRGLESNGRNK